MRALSVMSPQVTCAKTSQSVSPTKKRAPVAAVREDEICLYPSKKCTNPRAVKKNGELHTMCEYHRIRANENQRRLERRRKAALRLPHHHVARPTLWNRGFPEPIPIALHAAAAAAASSANRPGTGSGGKALATDWPAIELEILSACLFDEQAPPSEDAGRRSWSSASNTVDLSQLLALPPSPTTTPAAFRTSFP